MNFIVIAELPAERWPKLLKFEGDDEKDVLRKFNGQYNNSGPYLLKIIREGDEIPDFYIVAFEIQEDAGEDFVDEDFFDLAYSEGEIWKKFKAYLDKHFSRFQQRTIKNKELEVVKLHFE